MEGTTNSQIRRAPFSPKMLTDPQFSTILPLLNDIIPLDLPTNEFIQQMSGEVSAENTRNLVVHLLQNHQNTNGLC